MENVHVLIMFCLLLQLVQSIPLPPPSLASRDETPSYVSQHLDGYPTTTVPSCGAKSIILYSSGQTKLAMCDIKDYVLATSFDLILCLNPTLLLTFNNSIQLWYTIINEYATNVSYRIIVFVTR